MTGYARRHNQQQRAYQSRNHQHQRAFVHQSNSTSNSQNHSYHQSRQKSGSCSLTICYSYLLAIFSSFLVVLGLYLSITRFNAHFLYLSLAGLLIEALGACVYCISNIHTSKLAQNKQASDDFNIENNVIPFVTATSQISGERPTLPRQQQAQAVTHILTNRTLNHSAISLETTSPTNEHNINNNIANSISSPPSSGNQHQVPNDSSTSAHDHSQPVNGADNQSNGTSSSTGALLHQDTLMHQHMDENITRTEQKQLPNSDHMTCQEVAPQGSSSNSSTSQSHGLFDEDSPQSHEIVQDYMDVTVHRECADTAQDDDGFISTSAADRQASEIEGTDLIDRQSIGLLNVVPCGNRVSDVAIDEHQPAKKASLVPTTPQVESCPPVSARNRSPRNSNLRRTLVMGLGGEEEMIEIDEEDLDNMSILPPPYESIATVNDSEKHHPSQ